MLKKWVDYIRAIPGMVPIFVRSIPPTRPVLLIFDRHSSHISLELIHAAQKYDVHFLCLPLHTCHLLPPLDVKIFKALKSALRPTRSTSWLCSLVREHCICVGSCMACECHSSQHHVWILQMWHPPSESWCHR